METRWYVRQLGALQTSDSVDLHMRILDSMKGMFNHMAHLAPARSGAETSENMRYVRAI